MTFTFDGRLFLTDGTPNNSSSVSFLLQILDPSGSCVLYEESQAGIDLSHSDSNDKGRFFLKVGSALGHAKRTGSDPGNSMSALFSNLSTPIPASSSSSCPSGYTPTMGASRLLRVYVNDGYNGEEQLSPDYVLSSVPSAFVAQTLQGIVPNQLIQASGSLSQASLASLTDRSSSLISLADGTNTSYVKNDGSNFTPTTGVSMNNQQISQVADPTSADQAVNKSYSDSTFGGYDLVIPTPIDGQSIRWSTSNNRWETYTPTAGGTVTSVQSGVGLVAGNITTTGIIDVNVGTGANQILQMNNSGQLDLGGAALFNSSKLSLNAQGKLYLGQFTTAQETALLGTISASDQGLTWYNTTLGQMRIWNGSSAISLANNNFAFSSPLSASTAGSTTTVSLNLGAGLRLNASSLEANIGTAAGDWQTNSAIPNCSTNQKLQMSLGPVYAWSCVTQDTSPTGTAGGDLSGSYPAPTVAGLQGRPVAATTPAIDQILKFDGSQWSPSSELWTQSSGNITRLTGQVGIGTSLPAYLLDVNGSGRFTGPVTMNGRLGVGGSPDATAPLKVTGTSVDALIVQSTTTTAGINFRSGASSTANRIYVNDSNNYYFATATGIPMRIFDATGQVEVNNLAVTSGNADLGANKVVNLADPTNAQDAATKNYVDIKNAFVGARYKLSLDQLIPTSTSTRINFSSSDFDTGGLVTTGSVWKFTAPVAGYYRVSAKIEFAESFSTTEAAILTLVWNNGANESVISSRYGQSGSTSYFPSLNGSTTIHMNAGQGAWLEIYHSSSGSRNLDSNAGAGDFTFCTFELAGQ